MNSNSPDRRRLLQIVTAMSIFPSIWYSALAPTRALAASSPRSRVRPGDPEWPSESRWKQLGQEVGEALVKVQSPLAACLHTPEGRECTQLFKAVKNPYFLADEVGLTQTLSWSAHGRRGPVHMR